MTASAAAGVLPHRFWHQTPRETFAVLKAHAQRRRESRKLAIFEAWHGAMFERQKRIPNLVSILRKMEPARVMSPRDIRASIFSIAKAMGAKVRYEKRAGN